MPVHLLIAVLLLSNGVLACAQNPATPDFPQSSEEFEFEPEISSDDENAPILPFNTPPELRCSCGQGLDPAEERAGSLLSDPRQIAAVRTDAASRLWIAKSRAYSHEVIAFVSKPIAGGGKPFRELAERISIDLTPESIDRELRHGSYEWGAWLAFLRPHKDLVPGLLHGLSAHPKHRHETILALGASGDARALPALLERLRSDEPYDSGFAASALAYYGDAGTEQALIDALDKQSSWSKASACLALGAIGTSQALQKLRLIADGPEDRGAIALKDVASKAIQQINQRVAKERKPEPSRRRSEPSDAADSR